MSQVPKWRKLHEIEIHAIGNAQIRKTESLKLHNIEVHAAGAERERGDLAAIFYRVLEFWPEIDV